MLDFKEVKGLKKRARQKEKLILAPIMTKRQGRSIKKCYF
ncbi:hypothetical protein AsAng_0004620 [Aureispira anguillae]|uniref:Uncharacterized protein n=1 Tax=Aureispira anguillae TaxID=2864201 RepID=A0A915YAZ5_9BACT|nr:hypothetical protein AsAng_0004620 [Aureispira anguillae]